MTLDEAIKRAEEVAEEQEKAAKEWHENQVRKCELIRFAEMDYTHENECKKCADEHRKLTEWLKDYKRLLEQQSSEDCVSRQAVFETIDDCNSDGLKGIFCSYDDGERFKEYIKKLPPVTPTQCIAAVRFSKDDLREICNERIEIECSHGTCKDCKHRDPEDIMCDCGHTIVWQTPRPDNWYCADFEKRGNENE